MKKIILSLFLLIISSNSFCQWQWARHVYSDWFDYSGPACKDNQGNIYTAGAFRGDSCYFQTDTLLRYGESDFFIAKYNDAGNEIWINKWGGDNTSTCPEGINSLCFDLQNNCFYAYSCFCETAIFGNDTLTSYSERDIALLKLDTSGSVIWTAQVIGNGTEAGAGLAVDDSGNVYLCGTNTTVAIFDTTILAAGGFLAKYNSSGNCIWAKHICGLNNLGTSAQFGSTTIIYTDNSIYINGSATDDTLTIDTVSIATPNAAGGILTKFDLNGNIYWAKLFGYPSANSTIMGMDGSKDIYIAGVFFGDTAHFDTIQLTNNGQQDAFIIKCDTNGNFVWVKQLHSSGGAISTCISVSTNGDFYVTGDFSGNAVFGTDTITASTQTDMFLARYNSNGELLGADHFGRAHGHTVITDNNDAPIVTGYFMSTVQIGNDTFTAVGNTDIFIAKHDAITDILEERRANNTLIIYANPNKGICDITIPDEFKHEKKLTLSIYDNSGKLIQHGSLEMNEEKVRVNLEAEAKGIYNVTLSNGKKSYRGKIVFE